MKIRFLKSWGRYRRGQVMPDFHDGVANDLIHRGVAEEIMVAVDDFRMESQPQRMVPPAVVSFVKRKVGR